MKHILFIFSLVSVFQLSAQLPEPVKISRKYGFTLSGKLIIPAQYQYAEHFSSGLALVKRNGKWGYIDPSGKEVVACIYDKAQSFKSGYARVWSAAKTGLLDSTGIFAVEPGDNEFITEPDGFRWIQKENDDFFQGYVLTDAGKVIPADYKEITIRDDYAYADYGTDQVADLYYRGQPFLTGVYHDPEDDDKPNEAGLYIIQQDDRFGLIDKSGNVVVPFDYFAIDEVKTGPYNLEGYEYPFEFILALDKAEWFYSPESNGFLRLGEPKWILATPDGKIISDREFSDIIYHTDRAEKGEMGLQGVSEGKVVWINSPTEIEYTGLKD